MRTAIVIYKYPFNERKHIMANIEDKYDGCIVTSEPDVDFWDIVDLWIKRAIRHAEEH